MRESDGVVALADPEGGAEPRPEEHLADRLGLVRCYYSLIRPHMQLRFGRQIRTPAMQARLVGRRLTFRDMFTAVAGFFVFMAVLLRVRGPGQGLIPHLAAAH